MHGAPGRPSRPPASRKSKRRAAAEGHAPGIHEVSAGGSNPRAQRGPSADKTSIRPLSQRRNIAKLAACDTRIKARKALDTRFHAAARSRLDLEHRRRLLFVGARSFIFYQFSFFLGAPTSFFLGAPTSPHRGASSRYGQRDFARLVPCEVLCPGKRAFSRLLPPHVRIRTARGESPFTQSLFQKVRTVVVVQSRWTSLQRASIPRRGTTRANSRACTPDCRSRMTTTLTYTYLME